MMIAAPLPSAGSTASKIGGRRPALFAGQNRREGQRAPHLIRITAPPAPHGAKPQANSLHASQSHQPSQASRGLRA